MAENDVAIRVDASAEIGKVVEQRFAEIAAITRDYHTKVAAIEASSSQSNAGLGQVRDALARLDEITQRTAAAAEENAKASLDMTGDMETTFDRIASLEAMVTKHDKVRRQRAARGETGAVIAPTRIKVESRSATHHRNGWPTAKRANHHHKPHLASRL